MTTEVFLILMILAAVVCAIAILAKVLIYRAKNLTKMIQIVSDPVDIDPAFAGHPYKRIYFEEAAYLGRIGVSDRGIYLYSVGKFNALIPWGRVAALRLVDYQGRLVAHPKLVVDGQPYRQLLIDWDMEFDQFIPDSLSVFRG